MTKPSLIIAGSGGPIARHISQATRADYDVIALTRQVDGSEPEGTRAVAWNPTAAKQGDDAALDQLASVLDGARAVVNLAGVSIADGRMDQEHRKRVLNSRVDSTHTLVEAARRTETPPDVWIQASATGFYGDRGDQVLTEGSGPGKRFFLSEVTQAWEEAARPAAEHSRLVVTRFGVVFAEDAPAWNRMMLPIRLFVGGPLGSGEQWFPWIDGDELGRAVRYLIEHDEAEGVFNLTAPEPVKQKVLAKKAAARLNRPALFPAPGFLLRIVLGDAADELLLASQRVVPERLRELGYTFERPGIDTELDKLLG